MLEDRGRDHGIEDDGDLRGLGFARAEAAERAFGGDLADFLGSVEFAQRAGDGVPVIALHGAIVGLGDGDRGDRAIRAAVFADEAVGVGEDFVSGGGVEGSAVGVLDARIEIERGFFGAAGVVDAVGAGERVDVFVIEIEIARELAELVDAREFRRRDLRR